MSVSVRDLTKIYGEQRAVDTVSFTVNRGEIVGFLGPNGAGKTTTMKVISCFIPPTEGEVEVCGHEVTKDSFAVRQLVGYLPEHNPLYLDMYVKEYLQFVAGLHRIPKKRQRVQELIELTGLEREQHKLIGALSKGYRQRVGLAQAMVHDPEVLILDEPTSGLDPNQLVEIRALIRELGKEKTVIFSTHIIQEVQSVCDRVLIINRGRLVADDPIDQLQNRLSGSVAITVEVAGPVETEQWKKLPGIRDARPVGAGKWRLMADAERDVRAEIFRFAVDNELILLELFRETRSVEDVFQQLTSN